MAPSMFCLAFIFYALVLGILGLGGIMVYFAFKEFAEESLCYLNYVVYVVSQYVQLHCYV